MDQVHREDLAHLKTNIDPRHYREPCQYYGESFLPRVSVPIAACFMVLHRGDDDCVHRRCAPWRIAGSTSRPQLRSSR